MNDPAMAPINGISLERYADLGAAIDDVKDNPAEVKQVLAAEGVSYEDFQAAMAGWTARMQDMSLMGRVAMAYMPLYQQALARRKGGAASMSYEDFVAVSGAIKVFGPEAAITACGITMSDWTEAGGQWNNTMAADIQRYAGHHSYVNQEAARLQAGGQPKKATITRTAGAAPAPAPGPNPAAMPGASGMDVAMAQVMQSPAMQQQQQANAAIAKNPLGFALGQAGNFLTGGIVAGSRVMVAWSDGNSYPAQVMQAAPGQYLLQFDNGSQQWVGEAHVRKA